MADKDVMVDKLIMLLSTDWFRPYWSSIGIEVNEAIKTSIQAGGPSFQ